MLAICCTRSRRGMRWLYYTCQLRVFGAFPTNSHFNNQHPSCVQAIVDTVQGLGFPGGILTCLSHPPVSTKSSASKKT
jgi:hypothetical protein